MIFLLYEIYHEKFNWCYAYRNIFFQMAINRMQYELSEKKSCSWTFFEIGWWKFKKQQSICFINIIVFYILFITDIIFKYSSRFYKIVWLILYCLQTLSMGMFLLLYQCFAYWNFFQNPLPTPFRFSQKFHSMSCSFKSRFGSFTD